MKAILALLALAGAVVVLRIRHDARVWQPDEHEATVPMTWVSLDGVRYGVSFDGGRGNSATYLYNPRTGVLVSAN